METQAQEKFHQFESTMLSCRHIFADGVVAHFVDGVYRTSSEKHAAELFAEIKAKNPYLSYRGEVTADDFDPLAKIKRQAVEDYKRQVAAQTAKDRNFGTTGATAGIAGTATTAAAPGVTAQVSEGAETTVKPAGTATPVKVTLASNIKK